MRLLCCKEQANAWCETADRNKRSCARQYTTQRASLIQYQSKTTRTASRYLQNNMGGELMKWFWRVTPSQTNAVKIWNISITIKTSIVSNVFNVHFCRMECLQMLTSWNSQLCVFVFPSNSKAINTIRDVPYQGRVYWSFKTQTLLCVYTLILCLLSARIRRRWDRLLRWS